MTLKKKYQTRKSTPHAADLSVDDGELFVREEDVDFVDTSTDSASASHHTDLNVSLLDIARPAKQKGKKIIIIIIFK
jgi:hypothetical protein